MTETAAIPEKRPRLKFIDMARSCAILLMLEGHFTGAALGDEWRSEEFLLYKIWHNVHGLTSPLFFTVTGLIFVYLLSADNTINYFENPRVKKGFKRVRQLLFWGYFIQFNIWSVCKSFYYNSEFHFDWFYAFHVLQSISIGIFLLLLFYGMYKLINRGALYWYYLIGGLLLFTGYAVMKNYIQIEEQLVADHIKDKPTYWPSGAPKFIQNLFYGQYSDFSFVRYSGYTILGGMLGSIIRTFEFKAKEWWFGATFIITGLVIIFFVQPFFRSIDNLTEIIGLTEKGIYELNSTAFIRYGQVLSLLGILMLIDKYFDIKAKLFLKIGQNTLPIYVIHVIILYGGIFGIGLKPLLFDENLNPWISGSISLLFIAAFSLMVKYIEPLEGIYDKALSVITFKKRS
ncbi:MAG: acyltransferase family protein [Flavobacteriia bacterium]|jgi:hypothetical protein